MRTYVPRAKDLQRAWWVVDADGMTLGRLATQVASRLMGKHKPSFTPSADTGDHVVVVNASRVRLTGRKLQDKLYHRHSGYPGGLRTVTAGRMLEHRPVKVIEEAVWGMLPKGPLGRQMFRKLKVYAGPQHPHQAQAPQELPIPGAMRAR